MIRNVGAQNNAVLYNEPKNEMQDLQSMQQSTVQRSRTDELKQQIQSGQYVIDLRATAERMAQELKPQFAST